MAERQRLTVFLVSDSLGGTAERVYRSAAVQFSGRRQLRVERVAYAGTRQAVDAVLGRALAAHPALIVHTLVNGSLRAYLAAEAGRLGVTTVDVLGPMMDALSAALGESPVGVPGLSHQADQDYFRRVEAAEFAVRFDDGSSVDGRAIIVATGVAYNQLTAPGCDTLPVADLSGAIPVMGLWAMAAAQRDGPLG
jgi:regulator of PEP synthase PpsR (kinase-PPPase family)